MLSRVLSVQVLGLLVQCAQVKLLTAFVPSSHGSFKRCHEDSSLNTQLSMSKPFSTDESIDRRRVIFSLILPITAVNTLQTQSAQAADDRLFKPNPLTNPFLEKIRILEQAEADDIKYGGELAPGSPKGRDEYAKLLVPILDMQQDIIKVKELVSLNDGVGLEEAMKILNKPQFDKLKFKKTFNAFADNIYYSDPDRANLYLGGGAVPKNEQSIAYLLRNDILTNIENLQAEVAYLIKEMKVGNPLETEDLYLYSDICKDGMAKYLDLVPPMEVKTAKDIIAARS